MTAAAKAEAPTNYMVAQLDEVPGTPCPCGVARRAFLVPENPVASLHMTDITEDAQTHYHRHDGNLPSSSKARASSSWTASASRCGRTPLC